MTFKEKKLIHPQVENSPPVDQIKLVEFEVSELLPPQILDLLKSYYHSQIDNFRIKNEKISQQVKQEFVLKLPYFLQWIYTNFKVKNVHLLDYYNYKYTLYREYKETLENLPQLPQQTRERKRFGFQKKDTESELMEKKTYNLRQRETKVKKNGQSIYVDESEDQQPKKPDLTKIGTRTIIQTGSTVNIRVLFSPSQLVRAVLHQFQLQEELEDLTNYEPNEEEPDLLQILCQRVVMARIPEALFLIHDILRIVQKWIRIMKLLKQLLSQIANDPNHGRIKFEAKTKLTHQEIVRVILQFMKQNMMLQLYPERVEEGEDQDSSDKQRETEGSVGLSPSFVRQLNAYGETMNRKEKTIHFQERMWTPEVEQKFIELVEKYGNNCRKFQYIAEQLDDGKFSKEFLREKKIEIYETKGIKQSKKSKGKKKGSKTGSWKLTERGNLKKRKMRKIQSPDDQSDN